MEVSTRILDGCVLLIDAVSGVQCQTKTVWHKIANRELPAVAFVNKMDRVGADLYRSVESIRDKLQTNPVILQYPLVNEEEDDFLGFVDLLSLTVFEWPHNSNHSFSTKASMNNTDTTSHVDPIISRLSPSHNLYEDIVNARKTMIEQLAEYDEMVMDKFLEDAFDVLALSPQDLLPVLRRACLQRQILPVFCGASLRGKGVQALLDGIISFLPSPLDRPPIILIPHTPPSPTTPSSTSSIAGITSSKHLKHVGKLDSKEVTAQSSELVALAFKVVHDSMRGLLVYARIFSGTLSAKDMLFNTTKQKAERVAQALRLNGDDFLQLQEVTAGSICCLVGLRHTRSGDTLIADHSNGGKNSKAYILPGMTVPRPVFSLAIEPESTSKQKDLEQALQVLCIEDPSLQVELNGSDSNDASGGGGGGQIMLRGLGELHLEIVLDKLKRQHKLNVYTGKTYIGYRQSLQHDIPDFVAKYDRMVENRRLFAQFLLQFQVVPDHTATASTDSDRGSDRGSDSDDRREEDEEEKSFEIDEKVAEMLTAEELHAVCDCIRNCLVQGPRGYPVVGIKIIVSDFVRENAQITTPGAIRAALATNIMHVLKEESNAKILEPVMHMEIEVPDQFVGDVISDLTGKRRAQELELRTLPSTGMTMIVSKVPLQSILGYATSLRSMTQGEGVFSTEYHSHEPVDILYADL